MDRKKLVKWLWRTGGFVTTGAIIGSVSYAVVHDDPVPFVIGVLLSFPASIMLANSGTGIES
jgi:hypothetical protein